MKTAALHDLGQLDAWVLSTYQRLEQMDVPVFDVSGRTPIRDLAQCIEPAVLHGLSTDIPARVGAFHGWLETGTAPGVAALGTAARLSLLLRYLAAPLRYEPFSESPVHKAVPSARCLYPLDYLLLQRSGGRVLVWRYVPEHHGLHAIEMPGIDFCGNAAIVCRARIWSIAEKYGEFADFPPVLEAGHGFAQLGYLAALLGLAVADPVDREAGRQLCRGTFELPLFAVGLSLPGFDVARDLPATVVRLATPCEGAGLADRFPRLAAINTLFDDAASPAVMPANSAPLPAIAGDCDFDLLEVLRRRNAGNDRSGTAAMLEAAPADLLPTLLTMWQRVATRRARLAAEDVITASVGWIANGPVAAGLYHADGTPVAPMLSATAFRQRIEAMLPYRGMRFNLSTLAATLIIQADPVAAIARLGPAAIREVHMAAGAIAQDFSLAATALGLFARPVRMMREVALETELPLSGQVVYQLLCGFARRANPTMELL